MMSEIYIYKNSLLTDEKNFILDGTEHDPALSPIRGYLANDLDEVYENTNFQYIKHQLYLNIIIDVSQTKLDMGPDSIDMNYVEIINYQLDEDDEPVYENPRYYFIISKKWKSSNAIELNLKMDTLNSFTFNVDYKITDKTLVKRMHKDRFVNDEGTGLYANSFPRIIDKRSEEISAPIYKTKENQLLDRTGRDNHVWSLYYKNSDNQQNSPVDCYLYPDIPLKVAYQPNAGTLTTSHFTSGKYTLIYSSYGNGDLTFRFGDDSFTIEKQPFNGRINAIVIYNDGNDLDVYLFSVIYANNSWWWQSSPFTKVFHGNSISVDNSPAIIYGYERDQINDISPANVNTYSASSYSNIQINMQTLIDAVINSKNSIDRTLEENLKIINLPYCPTEYTYDSVNDKYTFDSMWSYDTGSLQLTDFNKPFRKTIKTGVVSPLSAQYHTIPTNKRYGDQDRFIKDSKLYHSDYYRPKFIYDSFTKTFPLEHIKTPAQNTIGYLEFDFIMSRNMVSKFLFKFPFEYDESVEDYENILPVSRNNEDVLYNSSYLNYIRTGYNYDLKSKERQEVGSAIGIGLNALGLAAGIGLSFVPGGQVLGPTTAAYSAIGIVSNIVNTAKNIAQNEQNIQRKLEESRLQSVSVLNADDYDLLYSYTDNKAKYAVYYVSNEMEDVLDDLFYYCGYLVNQQMLPNVTSRYWFNFLQASLFIEDTKNLTTEIEDDIKEKFEQGVTFLHAHEDGWDFNQVKENLETFLIVEEE